MIRARARSRVRIVRAHAHMARTALLFGFSALHAPQLPPSSHRSLQLSLFSPGLARITATSLADTRMPIATGAGHAGHPRLATPLCLMSEVLAKVPRAPGPTWVRAARATALALASNAGATVTPLR